MQKRLQGRVSVNQIGDRVAIKFCIEGTQGIGEDALQTTGRHQRTGAIIAGEAFGEGENRLEFPEHGADGDAFRRVGQHQATGAAPHGAQEFLLCQQVDDLCEVIFRRMAGGCDLGFADDAAGIGGAEHQGAHGKVGASGESHLLSPKGAGNVLPPKIYAWCSLGDMIQIRWPLFPGPACWAIQADVPGGMRMDVQKVALATKAVWLSNWFVMKGHFTRRLRMFAITFKPF